jgi:hypothetical protein
MPKWQQRVNRKSAECEDGKPHERGAFDLILAQQQDDKTELHADHHVVPQADSIRLIV